MFGLKFRTWMESHIVRPRKKQRPKDGAPPPPGKGKGGKAPETRALQEGASSKSLLADAKENTIKALRCDTSSFCDANSKCATIEAIGLSTPNHHGYIGTSNNLSSPESAYSTGYSTDGTSPGAGAPFPPPEYYINIRTGTHYFLPNSTNAHSTPSTFRPTNLQMIPSPLKSCTKSQPPCSDSRKESRSICAPNSTERRAPAFTTGQYNVSIGSNCNQNLNKPFSYLNPQKLVGEAVPRASYRSHRRTESCDESRRFTGTCTGTGTGIGTGACTDIPALPSPRASPLPHLSSTYTATSPRQRTRIRTNPWLSNTVLNACVSGTQSPTPSSFKNSHSATESNASSSSGFKKETAESSSSHGSSCDKRSPRRRFFATSGAGAAAGAGAGAGKGRVSVCSSSSSGGESTASDVTDDDLTLNEMMGKFDESYIYEKETDILSDSDPTDCDETDFEAQEGGDERDTQDEDELDFIDNGSLVELAFDIDNNCSPKLINKGHCTYHDSAKKARFRESLYRRASSRSKEETASPVLKRGGGNKEQFPLRRSTRDGSKSRKHEGNKPVGGHPTNNSASRGASEKKRARNVVHKSARERNLQSRIRNDDSILGLSERGYFCEKESAGGALNFNRILKQKIMFHENMGGTRSAGSTPIAARRKAFNNEVYSPKKTLRSCSNAKFETIFDDELETMSLINSNSQKRRSNSVSVDKGSRIETNYSSTKYLTGFSSELALIEADHEADLKYKQLILEAENILTTMKDRTPPIPHRFIPKPNIFSRNPDLESSFSRPKSNFERKELPASPTSTPTPPATPKRTRVECDNVETGVLTSKSKLSPCASPLLKSSPGGRPGVRRPGSVRDHRDHRDHRDLVPSTSRPRKCIEDVRSDSDGSLTPNQEDFDGADETMSRLHQTRDALEVNVRIETCTSRKYYPPRGCDSRTIAAVRSLQDDLHTVKSPLLNRKPCHQVSGREQNKSPVNSPSNRSGLIKESTFGQAAPLPGDKVFEFRKKLSGPLGSPLMEKRLKEIMTKENCGNMSPKVTHKAMNVLERTNIKDSDDDKLIRLKMVKSPTLVNVPRPPLVAFRSVDLGNDMDGSSYCPQSEPVKRKVYTCSASFDRLQKSLGEKGQLGNQPRHPDHVQATDNRNSLREELERLRERDEYDSKKPSSPAHQNQRNLSVIRRQLLVNTIEGLKRSLEDQSAKLHATYGASNIQQEKMPGLDHR